MRRFISMALVSLYGACALAVLSVPAFAANFKNANAQFQQAAGQGGAGLDTTTTLESRVGSIIQIALSLVGVVFFILMVYGGFLWMTARGDENEAKKAKDIIVMALIGLMIILLAYAATWFVTSQVFTPPQS